MRRIFAALACTALVAGIPTLIRAESLPGFTLFGGPPREDQLPFRLDYGGTANAWDRYRLRIPAKRMKLAVAQFSITYPNYYRGEFDTKNIEVRVKGKRVPLQEQPTWDKENHIIQIYPEEPVPAGSQVEIWFSNVRNPSFGGMFYFNCQIASPGDVPLLRYLGTWILTID